MWALAPCLEPGPVGSYRIHDDACLVRHGESVGNRAARIQGQAPGIPLTALGHRQAAGAAAALDGAGAEAVVASDLLRARQTATHVGRRLGLAVVLDPGWREQDFGDLQGRALAAPWGAGTVADEVDRLWADPDRRPPGDGESLTDLHRRVGAALARLPRRVIVVTHGGPIRTADAIAVGHSPAAVGRFPVPNARLYHLPLAPAATAAR